MLRGLFFEKEINFVKLWHRSSQVRIPHCIVIFMLVFVAEIFKITLSKSRLQKINVNWSSSPCGIGCILKLYWISIHFALYASHKRRRRYVCPFPWSAIIYTWAKMLVRNIRFYVFVCSRPQSKIFRILPKCPTIRYLSNKM